MMAVISFTQLSGVRLGVESSYCIVVIHMYVPVAVPTRSSKYFCDRVLRSSRADDYRLSSIANSPRMNHFPELRALCVLLFNRHEFDIDMYTIDEIFDQNPLRCTHDERAR